MAYFTAENWNGTREQLEIVNSAFDEAWGAIKGYNQREASGDPMIHNSDNYERLRQSLRDAINNEFIADIDCADLAEGALRRLGFNPKRSVYSLECE